MPPALDLTGQRFGLLTVLRRDGTVKWGKVQAAWRCRCDCGAEITVPQNRLPHRDSIPPSHRIDRCEDCRTHPCEICGTPIPARSLSKTCSDTCTAERRRRYELDWYHSSMQQRPEFKEMRRQRGRDRYRDLGEDERRAYNKARYEHRIKTNDHTEINKRARKTHVERMKNPEYAERKRKQGADWRKANLEKTRATSRDWRRQKRKQKAMREMKQALDTKERGDGENSEN